MRATTRAPVVADAPVDPHDEPAIADVEREVDRAGGCAGAQITSRPGRERERAAGRPSVAAQKRAERAEDAAARLHDCSSQRTSRTSWTVVTMFSGTGWSEPRWARHVRVSRDSSSVARRP